MLRRLATLDRTKVFLATLAVAVAGLFLPGAIGAIILYAVVAALAAVLRLTWAVTPPGMRVVRLAVLAGLAAIATARLL
jgi:hypothetical protein